jgi:hypothetical protein
MNVAFSFCYSVIFPSRADLEKTQPGSAESKRISEQIVDAIG